MSQPAHLLSPAALHAAAPGVLDVVFGPDGDFEGAPAAPLAVFAKERWWTIAAFTATDDQIGGALLVSADGAWPPDYESVPLSWCGLDLRIPTVAARLLLLIRRAARKAGDWASYHDTWYLWDSLRQARWTPDLAAAVVRHALALAPRIAALRTTASPR